VHCIVFCTALVAFTIPLQLPLPTPHQCPMLFSVGKLLQSTSTITIYYPHMPIGKVRIYRLLFVCFFVRLCVCTTTDFSAENKASGVIFCTAVHWRPRNLPFWGTLLPQKPKIERIGERATTSAKLTRITLWLPNT